MPFQQGPGQLDLSAVQRVICAFIWGYVRHTGYSPCYREIGTEAGLASASAVKHQIDVLVRKGFLTRESGQPRTLAVTSRFLPAQCPTAGALPDADETATDGDWIEIRSRDRSRPDLRASSSMKQGRPFGFPGGRSATESSSHCGLSETR
jgi:hypothetical protein